MIKFQVFDAPIKNPDDDLFGMASYAQKLASFVDSVEPPFTIGIYGQWGDGKSSFVNLVNHYLGKSARKEKMKFIEFSAWPHTTADAIWRALIMCIAKELYNVKDEPKPKINNVPFRQRLVEVMKKDAWTGWSPPPPDDPKKDYRDLLDRLDRTAYGTITKNKAEQQQFSEEAALMAIVKTGVSALGSLSPIIAGFRALFDSNSKGEATGELNLGKSASAREIIESVDEFKRVLKELFENTAKDKRVFVFIDDLDRCLPDAALDLLEATKIFFKDTPCIFIVAADENLIGQGLRLRFKDLLDARNENRIEQLINQKGKEYFEKIIQFPIRVPPRTTNQGHKFISAQFPQWTPATDIIQTALGINPRRLIQYCNLLSYKYEVFRMRIEQAQQAENGGAPRQSVSFEYLDKLIALHSWFPECVDTFNRLLSDASLYPKYTKLLEYWLNKSTEDTPVKKAQQELTVCGCDELYRRAVALAPIYKLMRSQPLFSEANVDSLRTFARMADIRPSTDKSMMTVRDSVFSRILSLVEERGQTTAKDLLFEDVTKLITLDRGYPDLSTLLFKIAGRANGVQELKAIEDAVENQLQALTVSVSDDAAEFLKELVTTTATKPELPAFFLSTPRFSSINPQEIRLYESVRDQLKSNETALNINFQSTTSPDRYSRSALEAIEQFPAADRKEIESTLQLQADAAQYFLELRRFTKLDALAFQWSDLAEALRANKNNFIRTYETPANDPVSSGSDEINKLFQQDPRLREFLTLRPLFSAINDRELNQYFAVAEAVVKTSDIQPSPTPVTETAPTQPQTVVGPTQAVAPVLYNDLTLQLDHVADKTYNLIAKSGTFVKIAKIELDPAEMAELSLHVQNLFLYRGGTRNLSPLPFPQDPMTQLTEWGSRLYSKLFNIVGENAAEKVFLKAADEALASNRRLRILIDVNDEMSSLIPWEALYIPSLGVFPALIAQGFSMVRLSRSKPLAARTMHSPLRILLVISTPKDAPYLEVSREKALLEESLDGAIKNNLVRLETIEHATNELLQGALRNFRPNILHFIGHGVLQREGPEAGQGALVLETEGGTTDLLSGNALRTMMGPDSSVSLAILNSCETGIFGVGDTISGVAQTLVATGTPAVIATMRVILDQAALMFTREFYRSFVDGFPLEFSVIEARKYLSINQADWAAYALFAGTSQLDDFKLVPTQSLR